MSINNIKVNEPIILNHMEFNPEQIDKALLEIEKMEHFEMCRMWRFAPKGSEIYFRSDLPTGEAFKKRLFEHFGGFTPTISKALGHN